MRTEVLNKIDNLARLCKASVIIRYNEHTSNYETIKQYLHRDPDDLPDKEIIDECVKADRVIEVQFYPRTPIGFYNLVGADLDKLLDEALEIAEKEII